MIILVQVAIKIDDRLGELQNKRLFLRVPEVENFEVKVLEDLMSDEGFLPDLHIAAF